MAVDQQQHPSTVPPHDLDAEESVLGAMLVSENAISIVSEMLRAEDFYRRSHAAIYAAIIQLYGEGGTVDSITLINALQNLGQLEEVGGKAAVHTLASTVPAVANAYRYAEIVRDASTYRNLIRAGTEIAQLGYERLGEPRELVDRAEQTVFGIADQRISSDFSPISTLLNESFERITQLHESGRDITGVSSGFRKLDKITAGFQPSNLIILAARPGMGKTSLALNIAAHVGIAEARPVAIFSIEMSRDEVTQRLMCSEGKVDSSRLRTGKLAPDEWPKLTAACSKLQEAPIFVDDTAGITALEIKAKTRRLKARRPDLALVVIDYLQLMSGGGRFDNRVNEISHISRQLKLIARDLDVPVLALSQLSRAVEQRGIKDRRPQLSDLRESGSIEQDADLVMFVYRDDYYDPESEHKGEAELIISKHRNGPLDSVQLAYQGRYTRFANMAQSPN
ncbi:MAG: replicative helicase [Gaiellales bacterium]|jgi:replicative DNA helicase|nr:replicative helicase [Gaiellales bacterium]